MRFKPGALPDTIALSIEGSWRDIDVPDSKAKHFADVINAWLVTQAGAAYTDAQHDVCKALGLLP